MRSKAVKRPEFDPRYAFVVTPVAGKSALAVGGKTLAAGSPFDKAQVTPRRLRQMYEARLISVAPGHAPLPKQPRRLRRAVGPSVALPPMDAPGAPTADAPKTPRSVPRRAAPRAPSRRAA